ncbi:MAG TPA: hypothetical protein VD996_12710 [Chitinophagaceae bacterium]|nr:hypothetical protein [Chitinophagaceae bacterium]
MNLLTYIIYLLIAYFITVHVGWRFYRNGRIYILNLLHGDEKLTDFINRLLLVGYYLLNLGYVLLTLRSWEKIETWNQVLASISFMTGKIMLILAVIHFINMAVILLISQRHDHAVNNKT